MGRSRGAPGVPAGASPVACDAPGCEHCQGHHRGVSGSRSSWGQCQEPREPSEKKMDHSLSLFWLAFLFFSSFLLSFLLTGAQLTFPELFPPNFVVAVGRVRMGGMARAEGITKGPSPAWVGPTWCEVGDRARPPTGDSQLLPCASVNHSSLGSPRGDLLPCCVRGSPGNLWGPKGISSSPCPGRCVHLQH